MKLPSLLLLGLISLGATTVASAQTSVYYFGRIGLFNDPVYVQPSNNQTASGYSHFTESGYAVGASLRFDLPAPPFPFSSDIWATNTISGITKEIGLYNPGTRRESTVLGITESGLVYGQANLHSTSIPSFPATASWVADAESGVTVRAGLYGPGYTGLYGFAISNLLGVTNGDFVYGHSLRVSDVGGSTGNAAWVMNTDNGTTYRIGFFSADYSQGNTQNSTITGVNSQGYISGHSDRFVANAPAGQTAWVATGYTGGTYLVGLYQPPLYLRPDGYGHTIAKAISDSGYIAGSSARFNGNANVGRAAWVHNLNNNTAKRVGLTTAEFTDSTTGTQISESTGVSESGYAGGYSKRFSGTTDLGQAAWIANFTDGIAVRAGLTGAEFTRANGYQFSALQLTNEPSANTLLSNRLPLNGNGFGYSLRYISNQPAGSAAWAFNKSTGVTTRVGYYGPGYIGPGGIAISNFDTELPPTDTGWAVGYSDAYNPSGISFARDRWAASAVTGVTFPLGLSGPDYQGAEGRKFTEVKRVYADGHTFGISYRYVAGSVLGQAAWATNLNTGTTTRIGLFSSPEFTLANGSQFTDITGSNKAGYVWGYSFRAQVDGSGHVAWVYHLPTGTQQTFKIQVTPDGRTGTTVTGVTENGLVYGNHHDYDPTSGALLGAKNFVWSPAKGVVILEDQFGAALTSDNFTRIGVFKLNRHGIIVANGERGINTPSNPGGTGVFRAYFAP